MNSQRPKKKRSKTQNPHSVSPEPKGTFFLETFFSLDLPNFPTFKAAARQHRTMTLLFFLAGYSLVILSLISIIFINQQTLTNLSAPAQASQNLPLNTAYGSQRHVFAQANGQAAAIYLDSNNRLAVSVSSDEGVNWQEPQVLVDEALENVSGEQDKKGDIHLAYEQGGQIFYRKIIISKQPWSLSEKVGLDISRLGHRPSLILDRESQLPVIAWSSEYRGTFLRGTQVLFMAARADPTKIDNWCNGAKSLCGTPAVYFLKGSADALDARASFSRYHPVLTQMTQDGSLYLFWSELTPGGRGSLKLAVGKREKAGWKWEDPTLEDTASEETAGRFSLAALPDPLNNRILLSYLNKEGKVRVVAYLTGGGKTDLGNPGSDGSQFSLASGEGGYYLFFRNPEGRVEVRRYTNGWSPKLWQSTEIAGHPSAPGVFHGTKAPFIYTTSEGGVKLNSLTLP